MSLIPLLDDSTDSIRESLSLEQIQIALSFLRRRFKDYSVKQIILSLNDYIVEQEYSAVLRPKRPRPSSGLRPVFQSQQHSASFLSSNLRGHRLDPLSSPFQSLQEDRTALREQTKLVAKLFCQSGIKFSLARYFFPDMSIKKYQEILSTITVQTLNNIEKYILYECNINNIDQLSRKQKRSIRDKFIHVREWMAKTHPQHFQTYLKFIERYYQQNQSTEIDHKNVFSLYKFILQIAKGPDVRLDGLEIDKGQEKTFHRRQQNLSKKKSKKGLMAQLNLEDPFVIEQQRQQQFFCNSEEENALIFLFKKYGSVSRTSDYMCQKFGYNLKWSKHSIKLILKSILKTALKKLVQSAKRFCQKEKLMFGFGDEDCNALFQYENSKSVKYVLLDFYLTKKITVLKLKEFIEKVNQFYTKQFSPAEQMLQQIHGTDDQVVLPTLIKAEPIQIEVKSQDSQAQLINLEMRKNPIKKSKKQFLKRQQLQKKKNSDIRKNISRKRKDKKSKKLDWYEVIELTRTSDQYSQSNERKMECVISEKNVEKLIQLPIVPEQQFKQNTLANQINKNLERVSKESNNKSEKISSSRQKDKSLFLNAEMNSEEHNISRIFQEKDESLQKEYKQKNYDKNNESSSTKKNKLLSTVNPTAKYATLSDSDDINESYKSIQSQNRVTIQRTKNNQSIISDQMRLIESAPEHSDDEISSIEDSKSNKSDENQDASSNQKQSSEQELGKVSENISDQESSQEQEDIDSIQSSNEAKS